MADRKDRSTMPKLSGPTSAVASERTPSTYPWTALVAIRKALGWFFATDRYLATLTYERILPGAGVRGCDRPVAIAYTGPDWLEKVTAEGQAYLDALKAKLMVLEAETLAELARAWGEFNHTFVGRSEVQAPAAEVSLEPEGSMP
jgi:hypothetical protein